MSKASTWECGCRDAVYAREVAHRAANALQQAVAAIHLSRRGAIDLDDAMSRITATIALNRALDSNTSGLIEAGGAIGAVAQAVTVAAGVGEDVNVIIDAKPLLADARTVRPVLMMVAELVGNTVRHAFPEGHGTVHVTLDDTDGTTRLVVEDDGACRGWHRTGGQGCGIVDALARSLGGRVLRSLTPGGSSRVEAVMPSIAAAAAVPAGVA